MTLIGEVVRKNHPSFVHLQGDVDVPTEYENTGKQPRSSCQLRLIWALIRMTNQSILCRYYWQSKIRAQAYSAYNCNGNPVGSVTEQ